jgi:hypothetical protein
MYKILRNDICKTHPQYKRAYLFGAVNRGDSYFEEPDPLMYQKIGLSQNPIERLPQVEESYNKPKTVKICDETVSWIPNNFTLLGYSDPLPFAASVETIAQQMLVDLYKDTEAIDVRVEGLKDWFRPTHAYHGAFCIFEAIKQCYKDSGLKKIPVIRWTIPTSFPKAGNLIHTIDGDYLHYVNNFKKKDINLTDFMYNTVNPNMPYLFPFNKWLRDVKKFDIKTRNKHLQAVVMFKEKSKMFPSTKEHFMYFADKNAEEGIRVYHQEFLKDKEFIADFTNNFTTIPMNIS